MLQRPSCHASSVRAEKTFQTSIRLVAVGRFLLQVTGHRSQVTGQKNNIWRVCSEAQKGKQNLSVMVSFYPCLLAVSFYSGLLAVSFHFGLLAVSF